MVPEQVLGLLHLVIRHAFKHPLYLFMRRLVPSTERLVWAFDRDSDCPSAIDKQTMNVIAPMILIELGRLSMD